MNKHNEFKNNYIITSILNSYIVEYYYYDLFIRFTVVNVRCLKYTY
jgi:hypothetical protein